MDRKDWDLVAKDYFNELSSPFEHDVINPLPDEIGRIKDSKRMTAGDIGCGIGNLIPLLSERFEKVIALDFSKGMVDAAKKRCEGKRNIELMQRSMTDLSELKGKLDVAFAINSIIMPSTRDVDASIKEIHSTIKEGGRLIAVFPSLESVLYESMLVHETQLARFEDEEKAAINTRRIVGKQYYDFYTGMIDVEGKQKHFYEFEIRHRLEKAGFRNIRIKKVLYPWEKVESTPLPESVKGKEVKLWDWFVTADK